MQYAPENSDQQPYISAQHIHVLPAGSPVPPGHQLVQIHPFPPGAPLPPGAQPIQMLPPAPQAQPQPPPPDPNELKRWLAKGQYDLASKEEELMVLHERIEDTKIVPHLFLHCFKRAILNLHGTKSNFRIEL